MRTLIALALLALSACGGVGPRDAPVEAFGNPPVCRNGMRRCNGLSVQVCQGGQWVTQPPCPAGQVCLNGYCATP